MGGKSQKVTQTSKVELPPWMEAAYQDLVGRAQPLADTPYNPATNRSVAGFSAPQSQAFQNVQNMQGIQSPYINTAANYATTGAAPVSSGEISNYLNPYQSNVIDTTLAQIARNNVIQQNQLKGNSVAQGGLRNSRLGVAQAQLARGQDMTTANILANLNSQNYNQALGAAQGDKSRAFQGASAFSSLGNQAQQAGYQDIASLLGIGAQQQGQSQTEFDTATANAQQQQQYPQQNLSWLASIVQGLGPSSGGTTSGSTTQPGPNPFSQVAGLGLLGLGLFSDERVKEDVQPVGKTFD